MITAWNAISDSDILDDLSVMQGLGPECMIPLLAFAQAVVLVQCVFLSWCN